MDNLASALLSLDPEAPNTVLTYLQGKSPSSDLVNAAHIRIEARQAQFLNPRWDVDLGDYVETSCVKCNDLGWYVLDVQPRERDFGKSFACNCGARTDTTTRLLRHSGIPASKANTFSSYKIIKGTRPSFEAAKTFADGGVSMLLIYGISGCGKTHLAQAAGRQLIDSGQVVKFMQAKALLLELKSGYSDEFDFAHRMEVYIKAPILILDDLDWRTEWDLETINDLICQREFADGRTLVTSNRKYADIQDGLPRVISRFSNPLVGRIVANEAGDYRRQR